MTAARQTALSLVEPDAPARIEVKNHTYRADDGPWLPGVTGVLRVQDALGGSDGLIRWAVNLAAKAAFDEGRASESPDFQTALEKAIAATEEPRNRGTRVHDGIDLDFKGFAHAPNAADLPLWYQWSRFLLRENVQILATEMFVVGDEWGGTLDLDAMVKGRRSLVDVKSGKWKDTFPLQLAGYKSCRWMAPKPDGQPVVPVPPWEAFYVLLLSDDAYELREVEVGPAEVDHFGFLVKTHQQLHAWNKRNAK